MPQAFYSKQGFAEILEDLREWYNGQYMGDIESFTPYSVMSYIGDLVAYKAGRSNKFPELQSYWGDTGTSKILNTISKLKQVFKKSPRFPPSGIYK